MSLCHACIWTGRAGFLGIPDTSPSLDHATPHRFFFFWGGDPLCFTKEFSLNWKNNSLVAIEFLSRFPKCRRRQTDTCIYLMNTRLTSQSILTCWCCHTKIPQTGWLKYKPLIRHLYSPSSGGWESKTRVSAGSVSSAALVLSLRMAASLLCPHTAFRLCEARLFVHLNFLLLWWHQSYWIRASPDGLILI